MAKPKEFQAKVDYPPPPLPEKLPPLNTMTASAILANVKFVDDPAELNLPEGYDPIKDKKTGKWCAPMDRNGNLRKLYEQWWETTMLDGDEVPISAIWNGRMAARYRVPPEYYKRKLCSAYDPLRKEWCINPVAECGKHCGIWSARSGRPCSKPKTADSTKCYVHTKKSTINYTKMVQKSLTGFTKRGYEEWISRKDRREIYRALSSQDEDLRPEIQLLRMRLTEMLSSTGDSAAAWLKLKDAWNRAAQAKSQEEVAAAMREVALTIESGVSIVAANEEMRKTHDSIVKAVGTQNRMRNESMRTVTESQVKAVVAGLVGIVVETWSRDKARLIEFNRRVEELLTYQPENSEISV